MSAITACSADSAGTRRSFVIEAASAAAAEAPSLRFDRINSRDLLAAARRVYFAFLAAGSGGEDPLGVVLSDAGGTRGRVVFSRPVLLPHEEFVALELLRSRLTRAGGGRSNPARNRSARTGTPL